MRKTNKDCTAIMKITEALLAEHQVFHTVFDHVERQLVRLKTLAEIKALAALLESTLKEHSATEDDLLFAPLDHCLEQMGQADSFHAEHEEIDRSLEEIQKARTVAEARRLLQRAVQASRHHFSREESIVFPLAEKTLKTKTLQQLGANWASRRQAAA